MEYLLLFLEGVISFISPCMLPMLPVYISFFSGGENKNPLKNSIGFVTGFTIVFIALGGFAGSIGRIIFDYQNVFNVIAGAILILFGLNYIGVLKIFFLNRTYKLQNKMSSSSFLSCLVFGIIFAVGWSPCVGVFLGSALVMASQSATWFKGCLMLFVFSLGLGLPFIFSAVLLDQLKSAFSFIKKHYGVINIVSGALLIALGLLIMTGRMGYFLRSII